ncbi:hypothetical protein C8R46DRAFT_1207685 [Mycena filopes]|nr:hypothetical protein C8R46DRAFT_1207685 [Mycena filopes]
MSDETNMNPLNQDVPKTNAGTPEATQDDQKSNNPLETGQAPTVKAPAPAADGPAPGTKSTRGLSDKFDADSDLDFDAFRPPTPPGDIPRGVKTDHASIIGPKAPPATPKPPPN